MNRQIGQLFAGAVILFSVLLASTSWWTVFGADGLEKNPENRRGLIRDQRIPRGLILASDGTVLARNLVTANVGDGIFVYGPWEYAGLQLPGAGGTVVLGNLTYGNGDDGIDVRSAATTITDNRADRNADLGIEATAGVTDGGRNHATGNGNPLQCVNVTCSGSRTR
jgi:hypothetical protein